MFNVERVFYKGYRKEDKVMLNKMEKMYHRFHKDNVEIYNPK